MKRIIKILAVFIALMATDGYATDTGSADKYPNYYAARRALDRGNCDAAVSYLKAFLRNHPSLQEKYRGFYLEIKLVMGQCTDNIRVRGIESESGGIDPLPDHPPMEE